MDPLLHCSSSYVCVKGLNIQFLVTRFLCGFLAQPARCEIMNTNWYLWFGIRVASDKSRRSQIITLTPRQEPVNASVVFEKRRIHEAQFILQMLTWITGTFNEEVSGSARLTLMKAVPPTNSYKNTSPRFPVRASPHHWHKAKPITLLSLSLPLSLCFFITWDESWQGYEPLCVSEREDLW